MIILDVMLPGIDGYEVCKQIRDFSHCPILFLSSKNDELDKILGLAVGGDDYVTKPFSPKEVAYRVKAQLRRTEYRQLPSKTQLIKVGALSIDPEGCHVTKDGKGIELTAREFEILHYMAQNIGRVISKERLYETVWGEDGFGCDNTIMVHIRHLREKIESNPTYPGVHYHNERLGLQVGKSLCKNKLRHKPILYTAVILTIHFCHSDCFRNRYVLLCFFLSRSRRD